MRRRPFRGVMEGPPACSRGICSSWTVLHLSAAKREVDSAHSPGFESGSSELVPESTEWSKGTPIPAAVSNSFSACRQTGHSARCAWRSFCSSSESSSEVERAHSSRKRSCGFITDQPSSPRLSALFRMAHVYGHLISEHPLSQRIQRAVIVVPHVSKRLPQLLSDLCQGVAFEEVQAQGLTLILRKSLKNPVQTITPKDSFRGIIGFYGRCSDQRRGMTSKLHLGIEMAVGEMAAPLDSAVVSHLHDPGAGRALRAVEDAELPLNEDEKVLNEIFRFGVIWKNGGGKVRTTRSYR